MHILYLLTIAIYIRMFHYPSNGFAITQNAHLLSRTKPLRVHPLHHTLLLPFLDAIASDAERRYNIRTMFLPLQSTFALPVYATLIVLRATRIQFLLCLNDDNDVTSISPSPRRNSMRFLLHR